MPGPSTEMEMVQSHALFHVELWEIFYRRQTDSRVRMTISKGPFIHEKYISTGASPHSVDVQPLQTACYSLQLLAECCEFVPITPLQNPASNNMMVERNMKESVTSY